MDWPRAAVAVSVLALALGCRHTTTAPPRPAAAELPLPVQPPTICRSHRREITQLIVTPAGDSAITVDRDDVAILWPELDADASPIRLDSKRPFHAQTASFVRVARDRWILTNDGERFDIDATGHVRERGPIAGPAVTAIILGGGTHFAVVRDDPVIDLVRADGRVVQTIREPGAPAKPSYPRAITSADGRTFLVRRYTHHGDVYRLDGEKLTVVSRAADRELFIAGIRDHGYHGGSDPLLSVDGKKLVVLDPESGWLLTAALEPGRRPDALSWKRYPVDISERVDQPIGFIAPDVIAFVAHGTVNTFDLKTEQWAPIELPLTPKLLHAAGGVVLGTDKNQLALRRTGAAARVFGGGDAFNPLWVAVSPSGRRIAWGEYDGRISIDAKHPDRLPVTITTARGPIVFVDDDRLVVTNALQLAVVDIRTRRTIARRELPLPAKIVTYDPTTRVIVVDHREGGSFSSRNDTFSRVTVGEGGELGPVAVERSDRITAPPDGLGPFDIPIEGDMRLHWDYAHIAHFDARGAARWTIRDGKIRQLSASNGGKVVAYAAWLGAVVLDGTTGEVLLRRCITPSRVPRERTPP